MISSSNSILVINASSVPPSAFLAKKKCNLETALTNGMITLLAAAAVSVSATWSATEIWVMTLDSGSPVAGTSDAWALPSPLMPN